MYKTKPVKYFLLFLFIVSFQFASAQKIESIYVNLYTDSLKKGTYNYINIDGKMPNGRYLPLDSTQLIFWASAGKFSGNSLWIDKNIKEEKIDIKVTLRSNPGMVKAFTMYIKKQPDPPLKTLDEVMKSKNKP